MKLASPEIKPPSPTKRTHSTCAVDSSLFFRAMTKAAGLGRKEIVADLRVSKTLVDGWFNGLRNDPFTQARRTAKLFTDKKRRDLLPAIVAYIIGLENFDEVVLDRIQQVLTKVVP